MDYQKKYIKYKSKYLNLKKMIGGAPRGEYYFTAEYRVPIETLDSSRLGLPGGCTKLFIFDKSKMYPTIDSLTAELNDTFVGTIKLKKDKPIEEYIKLFDNIKQQMGENFQDELKKIKEDLLKIPKIKAFYEEKYNPIPAIAALSQPKPITSSPNDPTLDTPMQHEPLSRSKLTYEQSMKRREQLNKEIDDLNGQINEHRIYLKDHRIPENSFTGVAGSLQWKLKRVKALERELAEL